MLLMADSSLTELEGDQFVLFKLLSWRSLVAAAIEDEYKYYGERPLPASECSGA